MSASAGTMVVQHVSDTDETDEEEGETLMLQQNEVRRVKKPTLATVGRTVMRSNVISDNFRRHDHGIEMWKDQGGGTKLTSENLVRL